jgi:hypothetical protein
MADRFDKHVAHPGQNAALLVRHCSAAANSLDDASLRSLNRFRERPHVSGLELESAMWVLLLLPFIGLLWVPFYNFQEPALFGFPFFYWYQLAWVPISSLLIWLVYRSRTPDEAP